MRTLVPAGLMALLLLGSSPVSPLLGSTSENLPVGVVYSTGTGEVLANVTVIVRIPAVESEDPDGGRPERTVVVKSNARGEYRVALNDDAEVMFNATGHQVLRMHARDLRRRSDCERISGCLEDVSLIPLDYTMWSLLTP